MFSWKRAGLIAAGLIIISLIFTVTILPGIIKDKSIDWVSAETGRELTIKSININPLSLTVEINGVQFSEKETTEQFIAWDKLRVSLSAASIFRRAPIIDEFLLEKPEIQIKRLAHETFNFSDLIPVSEDRPNKDESTGPFLFAVDNISINNGRIDLIDNSLEDPVHHTIEALRLALPTIGNLPHMVTIHAQPEISAVINDSPFNISGQIKPFTDVQEMLFDIKLDNIDLPHYLGYVPVELPVELRNGKLNLDLKILYSISPEAGGELELSGNIDLVSVNIWDRLEEQLFFLPLLQVEMAPSYPLKQDIHLSSLRIYNLEVQLNRDQVGTWNHSRMAPPEEDSEATTQTEKTSDPFKLKIDNIEVRDGVVVFEDRLPTGGFKTVAREINIDVDNFTLDNTTGIPLVLSLETDRQETVRVKGHFQINPFSLDLHNNLNNLSLEAYAPYYQEYYNKPLGGMLSLDADLLMNQETPLLVSQGNMTLDNLQVEFNDAEGFRNTRTEITGFSFDLGINKLGIEAVKSTGTQVNFSRSSSGEWSFFSQNFPFLRMARNQPEPPEISSGAEKSPEFSFLIKTLDLHDWDLDFKDNQPEEAAHLKINNMKLGVTNLAIPDRTDSLVKFSAELRPSGRIDVNGNMVLAEKSATLNTNLKRVPLKLIAPLSCGVHQPCPHQRQPQCKPGHSCLGSKQSRSEI